MERFQTACPEWFSAVKKEDQLAIMNIMRNDKAEFCGNNGEVELANTVEVIADLLESKAHEADIQAGCALRSAIESQHAADVLKQRKEYNGVVTVDATARVTEADRQAAGAKDAADAAQASAEDLSSHATAAKKAASDILQAMNEAASERVSQMQGNGHTHELLRLAHDCHEAASIVSAIARKVGALDKLNNTKAAALEKVNHETACTIENQTLLLSKQAATLAQTLAAKWQVARSKSFTEKNEAARAEHDANMKVQGRMNSVTGSLTGAQVAKAKTEAGKTKQASLKANSAEEVASKLAGTAEREASIALAAADNAASVSRDAKCKLENMQKQHRNAAKKRNQSNAALSEAVAAMATAMQNVQKFSEKLKQIRRTQPPFLCHHTWHIPQHEDDQTPDQAEIDNDPPEDPVATENFLEDSSLSSRDHSIATTSSTQMPAVKERSLTLPRKLAAAAVHDQVVYVDGDCCCCWWRRSLRVYPT